MRALDKDLICRINSPGYGQDLKLNQESAATLNSYRVIVLNPVSILHLFDGTSALLDQVETALAKGASRLALDSKEALLPIAPALLLRYWELEQFLLEGGLLVYFLCPPFAVCHEDLAFDNYAFLDLLGPDKQNDDGKRHMTSIQQGHHGDLAPGAEFSPFANYLKLAEVEWHTLIRSENLTDGYEVLACAAPNKCIAAVKSVGKHGGQIVFLPAPYLEKFDMQLMACIELWQESRLHLPANQIEAQGQRKEEAMSEPEEQNELKMAAPEGLSDPSAPGGQAPEPDQAKTAPDLAKTGQPEPLSPREPVPLPPAPPQAIPHKRHAQAPRAEAPEHQGPASLIGKLEEASRPPAPAWCRDYRFAELSALSDELAGLKEQMRVYELKISRLEYLVGTMESLKQSLLWAPEEELLKACHQCFQKIGFEVQVPEARPNELHLYEDGKPSAICYVVRSQAALGRAHLAHLLHAQAEFWRHHGQEPKGFLLANLFAETPPEERQLLFAEDLDKYAQGKGMCLFTTMQLLSIWKEVELGRVMAADARQELLAANGALPGYLLCNEKAEILESERL